MACQGAVALGVGNQAGAARGVARGRGYSTPPEGALVAVAAARVQATEAGLRADATEARAASETRATQAEALASVAQTTAAAAQQVAGVQVAAAEQVFRARSEAAEREMATLAGAADVRSTSSAAVNEARADARIAQAEAAVHVAVSAAQSGVQAAQSAAEMQAEMASLRAQLELERRTAALAEAEARKARAAATGDGDALLGVRRVVVPPSGNDGSLLAGGEAPMSEPGSRAEGLTRGGLTALDVDAWWALMPAELAVVAASHREHYRPLLEARSGAALRPQAHEAAARIREIADLLTAIPGLQTLEDAEDLLVSWAKASVARLEVLREGVAGGGWTSAQAMEDAYFVAPTVPEFLKPMWKHRRSGTAQHQQQQQQQPPPSPRQQQQQQQQQQHRRQQQQRPAQNPPQQQQQQQRQQQGRRSRPH